MCRAPLQAGPTDRGPVPLPSAGVSLLFSFADRPRSPSTYLCTSRSPEGPWCGRLACQFRSKMSPVFATVTGIPYSVGTLSTRGCWVRRPVFGCVYPRASLRVVRVLSGSSGEPCYRYRPDRPAVTSFLTWVTLGLGLSAFATRIQRCRAYWVGVSSGQPPSLSKSPYDSAIRGLERGSALLRVRHAGDRAVLPCAMRRAGAARSMPNLPSGGSCVTCG